MGKLTEAERWQRRLKALKTESHRHHRELHSMQRLFPANADLAQLHAKFHEILKMLGEEPFLRPVKGPFRVVT